MTGNLSFPSQQDAAITKATSLSGPVLLDLKGFTITGGGGQSFGVFLGFNSEFIQNTYPITIRNGTLQNFAYGVDAEQGGRAPTTDIHVKNLTFSTTTTNIATRGVTFNRVNSSTVSNCIFNGSEYGIQEVSTAGGNRYTNDTFTNVGYTLVIGNEYGTIPVMIEAFESQAPQ